MINYSLFLKLLFGLSFLYTKTVIIMINVQINADMFITMKIIPLSFAKNALIKLVRL